MLKPKYWLTNVQGVDLRTQIDKLILDEEVDKGKMHIPNGFFTKSDCLLFKEFFKLCFLLSIILNHLFEDI